MDPAALLQEIYRCYREKRLADVVELLSDDFKFSAQLPDDGDGDPPAQPGRDRHPGAQIHGAVRHPRVRDGPIIVTDGVASTQANVKFRHKKSGKVLETRFIHDWRVADGKARELAQRHDLEQLKAFLRSVGDGAA